jgi:hypothetical protein
MQIDEINTEGSGRKGHTEETKGREKENGETGVGGKDICARTG